MQFRVSQHEIRAGLTDLGTIRQRPDMFSSGVLSSFLQTMVDGFNTYLVAPDAVLNALVHVHTLSPLP
jgi:hypothetical protein